MIRLSFTTVLERNVTLTDMPVTDPYGVAWARKARVFVRALDLAGQLEASVEIFPDGLFWMPEGTPPWRSRRAGCFRSPCANLVTGCASSCGWRARPPRRE